MPVRIGLRCGLGWLFVVSAPAFAAPPMLPPGPYVGPGQSTTDVLQVAPSGKTAILGATPVPAGVLLTPAIVRETASLRHGAYAGTLRPKSGRVVLTLQGRSKANPHVPCRYVLTPAHGGWRMHSDSPACARYRGFSWGFSTGAGVLRPYVPQ
jgi:hypothetical protein